MKQPHLIQAVLLSQRGVGVVWVDRGAAIIRLRPTQDIDALPAPPLLRSPRGSRLFYQISPGFYEER